MNLARIHIPRPCVQNQGALAPTAAGWHCAACQTEVVNFTPTSQAEIIDSLAICKEQQVGAMLTTPVILTPPRCLKGPRLWLLALAVLLGWQPFSSLALPPQTADNAAFFTSSDEQTPIITVRGVVLDKYNHQPIPGTSISLKDTVIGVSAGIDGNFELTIPASQLKAKSFKLTISFIGYDKQQIKVKTEGPERIYKLRILLKPTLFSDF